MAQKGKIEKIDKPNKKVTIKGKDYVIGKKKWNGENLESKLEIGMEIEFEVKGANFDFIKILISSGSSSPKVNNNLNNKNKTLEKINYPYNFVRVNTDVDKEMFERGSLSGIINCTFINKSPLFFPGTKKEDNGVKGHFNEEFLKENGKYVIPGSSLKGSIRSVLEAISNSCFVNIEDERLEKRLGAGKFNDRVIGIIKKLPTELDPGLIVEAKVLKVKTEALSYKYKDRGKGKEGVYNIQLSNLIKNYEKIDTENEFDKVTNGKNDMDGILWISSNMFNKKHEKILFTETGNKTYKFSMNDYKDIEYLLNQRNERDLKKGGKKFYIDDLKSGDPIIFQIDSSGKAKNLAFSEIPRLRYDYSPYDLLDKELRSCETFEKACYACRVFGMTGNNNVQMEEDKKDKTSLQGRVFFSDGSIEKNKADIQNTYVTIKSLGEPHPTLTRFYLDNGTYDDNKTKIRGRKFYWHHTDKIDKDYNEFKKSITPHMDRNGKIKFPHNSSIKFMNYGNIFEFKVSFKDLKEDELGLLLLSLELEEGMLHKFGKAKALGFGSSKVTIESLQLESNDRYESLDSNSYKECSNKQKYIDIFKNKFNLENKNQWKDLKIIMNEVNTLDFSKSPFPEAEKKGEVNTLNWFTNNKETKLPKIQDYK